MATPGHAIDVQGLVRQFKSGPRAVDGVDLFVDEARSTASSGPTAREEHHGQDARHAAAPVRGARDGRRLRRRPAERRHQPRDRSRTAGGRPRPPADRPRASEAAGGPPRLPKSLVAQRAKELLERVGLTGAAERRVGTYSGGMRRRLDLALALVHHPRLVFLDEPTTGLDPQSRTALWEEVRRLAKRRGRHRLPHDAVPRGSRLARRPGRDHRPRAHRRRRDAGGPQG